MRSLPLLLLLAIPLAAQRAPRTGAPTDSRSGYDRSARATVLHEALVYVAADDTSQKVATVTPGHEVVIVDRSGAWVKVFANTDTPDEAEEKPDFAETEGASPVSGWMKDKGVVSPKTPDGDVILFGAAAEFEDAAAHPHAPKIAPAAAHLLYRRVYQYFPESPLRAEAAWRSADIRWQIEKLDASTLPSAQEQEAFLRPQLYEGEMKMILKTYPGSKQAALAAFDLLDNKLCGDWQGLPKCPEMEATLYLKYADQFRDGPRTTEALFDALYRQAVLVSMYTVEENRKRTETARARTGQLAGEMRTRFPDSDFTRRGQSLAFRVAQGLAVYGNDRE